MPGSWEKARRWSLPQTHGAPFWGTGISEEARLLSGKHQPEGSPASPEGVGPSEMGAQPRSFGDTSPLSQMQAAEPHSLHAQLHSKGKDEALATLAGSVSTAAAPAVTDVPRGRICTAWPSRFRMSSTGEPRVTVCGLLPSSVPSHRAGQPQACGRGPGSLHSGSVQFPCLHRVTLHLLTHDPLTKVKPRHQDQGHAAGLQAVTAEPLRVWAAPSSQFQGTARISKQLTSQTAVWPLCCFV